MVEQNSMLRNCCPFYESICILDGDCYLNGGLEDYEYMNCDKFINKTSNINSFVIIG